MGHHYQRKENNCLNCNAVVTDRFCGICGQENIVIKESFWGIISHFFKDITHYDGKFLSTLKYLLFRPGFLPAEYLRGRRLSYLNPIRLYVFTSAFFFLIFFTFYQSDYDIVKIKGEAYKILPQLKKRQGSLEKKLSTKVSTEDSVDIIEELDLIKKDIVKLQNDSTAFDKLESTGYNSVGIAFSSKDKRKHYKTLAQYDVYQQTLPKNEQDNFFEKRLERQNLYLKEKYNNNGRVIMNAVKNDFMHRIPQMLFVGLPLFALLLKLLYIRRKKYFYVSHVFFTIYLFCAYFIIILFNLWLGSLGKFLKSSIPEYISIGLSIFCFIYLYKAMRYFYEQGRFKTILKYILLIFFNFILMALIFTGFFLFSTITLK